MSNIYILEPPTSGKVLLRTTVGDIDIELWAKETPKTCRNFIQLCMEGYYNDTCFHRVVKGFIVQGGDPNGDGTGGDSIYGAPFKDEFHQRLRFSRRGLVAMANAGPDDNGSQFFFTLDATPDLQNKHTIFGKIVGDTVFNMLKLAEGLVHDERPEYPHKIVKTEILNNPFEDIEPRITIAPAQMEKTKRKEKKSGVKNFKLLSFGAEAEEDEEESFRESQKFGGKGKSSHDILDDPKLSSQVDQTESNEEDDDNEDCVENVRKKLKKNPKKHSIENTGENKPVPEDLSHVDEERRKIQKEKFDEIKLEIENVKKEYHKNKLVKKKQEEEAQKAAIETSETVKEYQLEQDMYKERNKCVPKKGEKREQFTLDLLEKFKQKLEASKQQKSTTDQPSDLKIEQPITADEQDTEWMSHELHFEESVPVLAKDANKKDDDWFEIFDPRNPLNKRRRGETVQNFKEN